MSSGLQGPPYGTLPVPLCYEVSEPRARHISTHDSGSFGSGTTQVTFTRRSETVWQGQSVMPVEQSNQLTLLQSKDSSFVAILKGDAPITTWEPAIGYEWPISVGQTFSKTNKVTNHVTKQTVSVQWPPKSRRTRMS